MSSLYSYDPYACNYNSGMSGSSSLYSSNYSDVYTYGEGISPYDPSYYTNNYSYNPNPYSPYENSNMMNPESNINNERYGYGRSRSYSTGSIYPSDYYERKNYFGNSNQLDFSSNSTVTNQFMYPTNNKKIEETASEKKVNTESKHNSETNIKNNFNNEYKEKQKNGNKSLNSNSDNTSHLYSPYSFTNNYNNLYQYNYNYSFGTETNQDSQNTSDSTNPSQPYNNKYNLYSYNSLYANSSMTDMYNGYSGYDSMDSSMMNDTNAFF